MKSGELAGRSNPLVKSHYLGRQCNRLLDRTFLLLLNNLAALHLRSQERKLTEKLAKYEKENFKKPTLIYLDPGQDEST